MSLTLSSGVGRQCAHFALWTCFIANGRPLSPVILQQALTSFCWPFVSEKRVKPLPAVACKLSPFLHLYESKDLATPKILAHWKTFTSQLTVVVDKHYDLPVDSNDLMRLRFLHRQAYLELIRTEQKSAA